MPYLSLAIAFLSATAVGYGCFYLFLRYLPRKLQLSHASAGQDVLGEAKRQAESIRTDALATEDAKIQLLREELEDQLLQFNEDMKLQDEALKLREHSVQAEEARLKKIERDAEEIARRAQEAREQRDAIFQKISDLEKDVVRELEKVSAADAREIIDQRKHSITDQRQLETQKAVRFQHEELTNSLRRISTRVMARASARYAPEFYWPKMINHVDLTDAKQFEFLTSEEGAAFKSLIKEVAGIEAEALQPERPAFQQEMSRFLKLSGGMGADREAARLALIDTLKTHTNSWPQTFRNAYKKHRDYVKAQAIRLGKQAIHKLKLQDVHPEVELLVGYLNWRTSYRQNQYLHSFEVAQLAGIVALEVGVDPQDAKRCGLLHDIGKVLDYRIEGSHAVISGDYADRYGEKRYICDALMSHHNDLVVETPLAYVLKTADTLSGARPGARVNLEEGYQERLSGIVDAVKSFPGVTKTIIMNGAREVHVEVNFKRVRDEDLEALTQQIARKIEADVSFPGQIKVLVTRRIEASAVA